VIARRTAVVTGAASGLGRALAEALVQNGWHVACVDLPDAIDRWNAAEPTPPDLMLRIRMDVRHAAEWTALRDRLRNEWQVLDLLVNAAGVGATGEVGTMPESQWRRVIDTNLVGTALGCETFLPWLRAAPGRSHVVNVASIAAILAPPSMAAYSASKAGVVALSEAIAAECPRRRPTSQGRPVFDAPATPRTPLVLGRGWRTAGASVPRIPPTPLAPGRPSVSSRHAGPRRGSPSRSSRGNRRPISTRRPNTWAATTTSRSPCPRAEAET
jgi:NAD(P)-dependent dehydrogenase (short-subunit alcohol dehydrogenase family)